MLKDTLVLIDYTLGKLGAVSENLNQLLSPEGVHSVQVTTGLLLQEKAR